MFKRLISVSMLVLGIGAAAMPAFAADKIRINGPTMGSESQTVSFGDLDINSPKDAKVLLARLNNAAAKVCGLNLMGDIRRQALHEKCVQETVNRAVAAIDSPTLTALNTQTARPVNT